MHGALPEPNLEGDDAIDATEPYRPFSPVLMDWHKAIIARNAMISWIAIEATIRSLKSIRKHGLHGSCILFKKLIWGVLFVLIQIIFKSATMVPGAKGLIQAETRKVIDQLKSKMDIDGIPKLRALPKFGLDETAIKEYLLKYSATTVEYQSGKVSGAVYHGNELIKKMCCLAYTLFSDANPLHPDIFPAIRQMESEVVAFVLNLYHGNEDCCGTMTSGGTESILLACKAYRDKASHIAFPEMVVSKSAHAAFFKAAKYFKIKLVLIDLDENGQLSLMELEDSINSNTIMIAASAPSFPHGIIDNIPVIAEIAASKGIGLHVDCCLGSFLVPFLDHLGTMFPLFDFRVPGVTSISCDTHKYGFAPKGSSVIMYSSRETCQFQYHVSPDWMGGIYASPTLAGSRPGALVAGCWTALMMMGEDGYLQSAKQILLGTQLIANRIRCIPDLQVIGNPLVSVVAFTSKSLNIYSVNDEMTAKGYHLNALQDPPAVHIAVTGLTSPNQFLTDLEESVQIVRNGQSKSTGGSAGIYGMAASIPDKSVVGDIAKGYLDALYS